MTTAQPPIPWGRVLWETLKSAPMVWKVVLAVTTATGSLMGLVGLKVVSVPMMEVSRLSAQGLVNDTAIKSIRYDVDATKFEVTKLRVQINAAMKPGLIDLCLTRTYDQVVRMGLNCDSLGVVKQPPR